MAGRPPNAAVHCRPHHITIRFPQLLCKPLQHRRRPAWGIPAGAAAPALYNGCNVGRLIAQACNQACTKATPPSAVHRRTQGLAAGAAWAQGENSFHRSNGRRAVQLLALLGHEQRLGEADLGAAGLLDPNAAVPGEGCRGGSREMWRLQQWQVDLYGVHDLQQQHAQVQRCASRPVCGGCGRLFCRDQSTQQDQEVRLVLCGPSHQDCAPQSNGRAPPGTA